jgi:protein tyrosine/serine phosphatase
MGVRGLQKRLRRLETRAAPRSPIENWYGSLDAFVDQVQAEIDAGKLCRTDGPILLHCISRFHRAGLWGAWQRRGNQMLEYGG